ncbi:MAG: DNA alkylation repair protein [Bacillaceae bacterium]|nr:DNA alkylation repair protein [Bacillaceae bacterium]
MPHPYLCPNCRSNRSRFNIIAQVTTPVKMDPHTGEVVEELSEQSMEPYHVKYNGPQYKVQCGVCGLVENEITFIKHAENDSGVR